METDFERRYGFERSAVRLENWRLAPWSRWSFHNVSELVPSTSIEAEPGRAEDVAADASGLLRETVDVAGEAVSLGRFLDDTHTDVLVAMKAGRFVADHHAPTCNPAKPHIAFSISKSLTALLAGALEAEGSLDLSAPIIDHVPEMHGSAYGDATVRHLLDMQVDLAFEEDYLNQDGAYARYRRATLWNPALAGQPVEGLVEFLATLRPKGEGHGVATRYQSPNTDLLGVVVERAAGMRYADVASRRLWRPLGARTRATITVDAAGTARAAGGISLTGRDLARVGEMMRRGGELDGRRVLPQAFVEDTCHAGSREAWRNGDLGTLLPEGSYRNCWYQTGLPGAAFAGIGIHGQWLYVAPDREVVIVRLSSQSLPVDDIVDHAWLSVFDQIARRL